MSKAANNISFVAPLKEDMNTLLLSQSIADDKWVTPDTIIVNCYPDYSSILSQTLNQFISSDNKDELMEVVNLKIPPKSMSQIYSVESQEYIPFENYLLQWATVLKKSQKYLFVSLSTYDGTYLSKVRRIAKARLDNESFRFATIFKKEGSLLIPDYFVEEYPQSNRLVISWMNTNIKNKEYE